MDSKVKKKLDEYNKILEGIDKEFKTLEKKRIELLSVAKAMAEQTNELANRQRTVLGAIEALKGLEDGNKTPKG